MYIGMICSVSLLKNDNDLWVVAFLSFFFKFSELTLQIFSLPHPLFLSKIPITQMLYYVHTVPNVQMIYLAEVCFVCGVPWVGCFYSADFFQVYGFLLLFCQCSSFISL